MDVLKLYKVTFVDNKATVAEEVGFSNKVAIESEVLDGRKILKSMTIFATSKEESIITAQGMADLGNPASITIPPHYGIQYKPEKENHP